MTWHSRSMQLIGPRLLTVVVLVLVGHLLLLKPDLVLPQLKPIKHSENDLSIRLVTDNVLTVGVPHHDVTAPSTSAPRVIDAAPNSVASDGLPNPDVAGATDLKQVDGELNLAYELADIAGLDMRLGTMNLNLQVQSGSYVTRAVWHLGEDKWETTSSGVANDLFRPRYISGRTEPADLLQVSGDTQDQLSIVWSLRNQAKQSMSQSPSKLGQTWHYRVQFKSEAKLMYWQLESMDDLILPAGRFRAAKIGGVVDQANLAGITVWYAVDFDFLPIRIQSRDGDGRVQDLKLSTELERKLS
ncbi:DUF3108 domain-containing protein [Rhodoferax aquaticus]|uniref:DUF3108 domain-containing protein n=1 Tax=Rhodoferax aquaticus TaxID=2527691 RepID=A0A515EJT0_9BURK|nr:DUF3108 domain-containing protein [Rhodoferax aquaticus]QDL52900.1 DUF3108 domain-containing protein [Rhodoferax aquaticus]